MPDEEIYANVRAILGSLVGRTLLDITQHDEDEFKETHQSYIQLHFDNGEYLKFPIGDDGFDHNCGDGSDDDEPNGV